MSYTAAETGRVKSIKSKFENLNCLESLDISVTVPNKYRKPSPSFLFKRSSTSIDLPIRRIAVANNSPSNHENDTKKSANQSGHLRRHNNLDRTVSADASFMKKRNLTDSDEDTLKPLKEIKENVEVRLTRHINDPVKRSSIKRSPAFRVGDKSNCNGNGNGNGTNNDNTKTVTNLKSNRCENNSNGTANSPPVIFKKFADKFENLLKRCDIESKQEIDEPAGLTDTLKKVLRQPLPSGPPPKKPPRTFIDSPKKVQKIRNNITNRATSTMNVAVPASISIDEEKSQTNTRNHVPASTNVMRQKIDLLENQLILKSNHKSKGSRSATAKEKHPFSSSLLNCIPCSSASIYDTMTIGQNQFGKVITSKEPSSPEKNAQNINKMCVNRQSTNNRSPSEPIYMEPFAHLKQNAKLTNGSHTKHCGNFTINSPTSSHEPKLSSSSNLSNGSFDGPESLGSSLTSCTSCTADDISITDLHDDVHYMVSSIQTSDYSIDHLVFKCLFGGILGFLLRLITHRKKSSMKHRQSNRISSSSNK